MFPELEQAVTRLRPTIVPDPYDPRGPGREDWTQPIEHTIDGLIFAPSDSRTPLDEDRAPTITGAAFYGTDPATDIRTGDRLRDEGGTVWRVAGDPERWDPRGSDFPGGIVIPVERVTEGAQ